MAYRLGAKTVVISSALALAAIVILSGILSACAKAPTTTSAPVQTKTASAPASTTTSAPKSPTTTASTTAGVSAADFYKANVVTVVVPSGAGGGTDFAARLFANYWTEVTGGRMIVVNKEGGGSIIGNNYTYAAKPDGLTMGIAIPGAYLLGPMLGRDPAVKFDLKKMNWIGYSYHGDVNGLAVGAKSPYNSMQDLQKVTGLKFTGLARSDSGALAAGLLIEFFGLKDARIVVGYSGAAEAFLALGKGEVDAYSARSGAILDNVVKGLAKRPILTVDFNRSRPAPEAPAIPELVKLSPEQENLLTTWRALKEGQVFWFGPGVAQDRIDFVRSAFTRIVAIDGWMKQADVMWPYRAKPSSGEEYAAEMGRLLAIATPERFDEVQKVTDKYLR